MVIAMVLVGLLIFATFKAFSGQVSISLLSMHKKPLLIGTGILLFFTMIQMILGTQVREAVDVISRGTEIVDRANWLNYVGFIDEFHRSFSWTVLLTSVWMLWYIRNNCILGYLRKLNLSIFLMIVVQVIVGITLAYFGMPAIFQVLHLIGSAILISMILLQFFSLRDAKVEQ